MKKWIFLLSFILFSTHFTSVSLAAPFSNIYVFGDSLSDQGNLFAVTEVETGIGIPDSDHYFNGRFSNGEIAVGLLAEKLGINLSRSFDRGNNFAYGGARTGYNRVEASAGFGGLYPDDLYPWTLLGQKNDFSSRNIHDPNALFFIWSGSNDLADLIGLAVQGEFTGEDLTAHARQNIINGIKATINVAVAAGGKYIFVPNIPDLGVVPRVIRAGDATGLGSTLTDAATQLVASYNTELDALLDQYEDILIIRSDMFTLIQQMVENPSNFGLVNSSAACYSGFVEPDETATECENPDGYMFWDNEHPTTAAHRVMAEYMFKAMVLSLLDHLSNQIKPSGLSKWINQSLHTKVNVALSKFIDANITNNISIVNPLTSQSESFIPQIKTNFYKYNH